MVYVKQKFMRLRFSEVLQADLINTNIGVFPL